MKDLEKRVTDIEQQLKQQQKSSLLTNCTMFLIVCSVLKLALSANGLDRYIISFIRGFF